MKYPLPSYAASIYIAGDTLWLGLPSWNGEDRGHSVPIPATQAGLAELLRILQAREREQKSIEKKQGGGIGTDASPTRGQIEAALARREAFRKAREAQAEPKPKPARKPQPVDPITENILKELGII